jgi:hypothetical protein
LRQKIIAPQEDGITENRIETPKRVSIAKRYSFERKDSKIRAFRKN